MADFQLQEVDDIGYPKRRPWLILIVLAVVALVVLLRRSGDDTEEAPPPEPETTSEAPAHVEESPPDAFDEQPVAGGEIQDLLARARKAEARHPEDPEALAEARTLYLQALRTTRERRLRGQIEKRLGDISVDLALTPLPWPGVKVDYVVQRGDSIERIARRFGTTVAQVQKGNLVRDPNLIKAGDRFKIFKGQFAIHVDKTSRHLVLTLNNEFFKRYTVGTGKFGRTPTGTFTISDRITEPVWWRSDGKEIPYGDPENILGTRWMAIRSTGDTADVRGYGIHGTWNDDSIGLAESAGCIRMRNSEVEELFDLVPLKTPVRIVE